MLKKILIFLVVALLIFIIAALIIIPRIDIGKVGALVYESKNDSTNEKGKATSGTIDSVDIKHNEGNKYDFKYAGETFKATYKKNTWHIENSYKITNAQDIKIICQALIDIHPIQGADYKSYRTADDMCYEWIQHNIAYTILPEDSNLKDDAKDVDLNPEDQGKDFKDFYESRTGKKFDVKNIDYKKYLKYLKDNLYENY